MKKLVFGVPYPYRCPDCPELHAFKSRVKFATHHRARHPASDDVDPSLCDLVPLGLSLDDFELGELGHRSGTLPSLDAYDEAAR